MRLPAIIVLAASPTLILGGPLAYGVCQAGCSAVATACYAAAGCVWGVAIATIPASIKACNTAFGTCEAACYVAVWMPVP